MSQGRRTFFTCRALCQQHLLAPAFCDQQREGPAAGFQARHAKTDKDAQAALPAQISVTSRGRGPQQCFAAGWMHACRRVHKCTWALLRQHLPA